MTVAVVGEAPVARGVAVERVLLWRDVLHRPAADGSTSWKLGSGEVFLLGDFPSGSIDSRQFGPVPRRALRHRVVAISR
jgi:type IV secretory pathway protease TraF